MVGPCPASGGANHPAGAQRHPSYRSGTLDDVCGRYAASRNPDDLVEEFELDERPEQALEPSWNVAPTQDVYAVLDRAPRGEPAEPPRRRLQVVRWGLVPSWAKDPSIGNRMINARMETVADKPAFRKAFAKRRALLQRHWQTMMHGMQTMHLCCGGPMMGRMGMGVPGCCKGWVQGQMMLNPEMMQNRMDVMQMMMDQMMQYQQMLQRSK